MSDNNTAMRVSADIDLKAAVHNMEMMHQSLDSQGKSMAIAAVIKTDAYGHGAVKMAECLERLDYVWGYCVATWEEAKALRDSGIRKPVLLLGYVFPYCYEQLALQGIRPAVFRSDQLHELNEAAGHVHRKMKIHIAVDTGMSRIGIRPDESGLRFVKEALSCPELETEGIFTHFSKADMAENGQEETRHQHELFLGFTNRIEEELGYRIPIRHCDNSAGILSYPQYEMDMVRAGITLYGLWPSRDVSHDMDLQPVLSLHSHIVYVKDIYKGESVSYGGTFTADHTMRIATVPVGYGDGYPRSLSSKGYVLIHGKRAPVLGRVCMDQLMADVSDIPGVRENDVVTLIGNDGDEKITCEELGSLSGRFNYELVCDLNQRVPRVYHE